MIDKRKALGHENHEASGGAAKFHDNQASMSYSG